MYVFDPYIRTMYGPDIPFNPYIVATLKLRKNKLVPTPNESLKIVPNSELRIDSFYK